jgi:hypothetical protein
MFGIPSPISKDHFDAQINKENQILIVDMYGDDAKTAADIQGAMVNMVGNDLLRAHIIFDRGIDT